ncbi:MAG: hypothetical protein CME70_07865 [Halobacteriovorax sp.]|nr:hypothetical protein [Halobacteriovorax sp.]|tara:strand:- start:263455 stop:263970 length:516 start_codon:yes stop_codon:yes gene_type:complete
MVGKNLLLGQLLRILTPDELNELTTTSKGRNLVSLTKMLSSDLDEETGGAKILPFKKKEVEEDGSKEEERESLAIDIECGPNCKSILDDHVKRITVLNRDYSKNCPVSQETSSFIISEKSRFKENYNKIKSKEVLSLYEKNASIDIQREKNQKEDLSNSSNIGILVNKKQA